MIIITFFFSLFLRIHSPKNLLSVVRKNSACTVFKIIFFCKFCFTIAFYQKISLSLLLRRILKKLSVIKFFNFIEKSVIPLVGLY